MANTDKVTQQLLAKVAEKKKQISKAEKPVWNTNCNFSFPDGTRFNLHTVSDEEVILRATSLLIVHRNAWREAAELLGSDKPFNWNGNSFDEWKEDFQTRLTKINIEKKKKELAKLESRLDAIISPELRAQMELEAIAKELED